MAEKAGADGFVSKAGNIGPRLTRALQNLFGSGGPRRATASGLSLQDSTVEPPEQDHAI